MKLIVALSMAALAAAPLAAQESETKTKTKIEVHNGEKITATGCVEQGRQGLILTDVGGGATHSYLLVGKNEDLAKHVGHRVEVVGKAADRKEGKVVTETKSKVEDQKEQKSRTTAEGELTIPALGVEHVKMLSASCR